MPEGLDLKLKSKWNKKLEKAGLPEELEPIEMIAQPAPGREEFLEEFKTLPNKIQDDILKDLKEKRKLKMPPKEILDRFKVLVAKGQELDSLTAANSDKVYTPKPFEEKSDREIKEQISEGVDELIKEMEKIKYGDNLDPEGIGQYIN